MKAIATNRWTSTVFLLPWSYRLAVRYFVCLLNLRDKIFSPLAKLFTRP
nr:MAG TPA: hypothetical protein [Bacteriophage sp.]DAJ60530.1 MAG TPA: hypothetical protein [Caudoviricetes sp.]